MELCGRKQATAHAHVRPHGGWLNFEHTKKSNRSKKNNFRDEEKSNSNLPINSKKTEIVRIYLGPHGNVKFVNPVHEYDKSSIHIDVPIIVDTCFLQHIMICVSSPGLPNVDSCRVCSSHLSSVCNQRSPFQIPPAINAPRSIPGKTLFYQNWWSIDLSREEIG